MVSGESSPGVRARMARLSSEIVDGASGYRRTQWEYISSVSGLERSVSVAVVPGHSFLSFFDGFLSFFGSFLSFLNSFLIFLDSPDGGWMEMAGGWDDKYMLLREVGKGSCR